MASIATRWLPTLMATSTSITVAPLAEAPPRLLIDHHYSHSPAMIDGA